MYIAVDIGGTTTRVASFDSPSSPLIKKRDTFPTPQNYEEGVKKIVEMVQSISGGKIDGLGVCIASPINSEKKRAFETPKSQLMGG